MTQKTTVQFDGQKLVSVLKRVHLKGLLEECTLTIEKGQGKVYAFDHSGSVVVMSKGDVCDKNVNLTLGLTNLTTIISFIEGDEKVEATIETGEEASQWLTLSKGESGQIRLLLAAPGSISTDLAGDPEAQKQEALHDVKATFDLIPEKVDQLLNYISLLGCSTVVFKTVKGDLIVTNNEADKQQFTLKMGYLLSDPMRVEVFSQTLVMVLNKLNMGKDEAPTLSLGEQTAVIIQQNKDNLWLLKTISD